MQTQEKTLNELVTELGFTASFHELPASYKLPEWAVKYEKRAVIAKLTFRGNSFSFPYYYGTQKNGKHRTNSCGFSLDNGNGKFIG